MDMDAKQLQEAVINFGKTRRELDDNSFREFLNKKSTQEFMEYVSRLFDKIVYDVEHFNYYVQDFGGCPRSFVDCVKFGKRWPEYSSLNVFYKIEDYHDDFIAGLNFLLLLNVKKLHETYKELQEKSSAADDNDELSYYMMCAYRSFAPYEILDENFSLEDFKFVFGDPEQALLQDIFYHELNELFFSDEPGENKTLQKICEKLNISERFMFQKIGHMDYDDFLKKHKEELEENNNLSMH